MNKRSASIVLIVILLAVSAYAQDVGPREGVIAPTAPSDAAQAFGRLPIIFEENQGQARDDMKFLARSGGYTIGFTPEEAVLRLANQGEPLRLKLMAISSDVKIEGIDELPGKSNYLIGSDPSKWRTRIRTFTKVKYEGVYPGIDLVYYAYDGSYFILFVKTKRQATLRLQKSLRVQPGGPLSEIRVAPWEFSDRNDRQIVQ